MSKLQDFVFTSYFTFYLQKFVLMAKALESIYIYCSVSKNTRTLNKHFNVGLQFVRGPQSPTFFKAPTPFPNMPTFSKFLFPTLFSIPHTFKTFNIVPLTAPPLPKISPFFKILFPHPFLHSTHLKHLIQFLQTHPLTVNPPSYHNLCKNTHPYTILPPHIYMFSVKTKLTTLVIFLKLMTRLDNFL